MARAETPAEERFSVVYQFMWKPLRLTGVTLNIFARIYGFCRDGTSEFYENRAKTAEFLGTTARMVTRSSTTAVQTPSDAQLAGSWMSTRTSCDTVSPFRDARLSARAFSPGVNLTYMRSQHPLIVVPHLQGRGAGHPP